MDWDHLAERYNQQYFAAWLQLLSQQSPDLPLRLASEHYRRARATEVLSFTNLQPGLTISAALLRSKMDFVLWFDFHRWALFAFTVMTYGHRMNLFQGQPSQLPASLTGNLLMLLPLNLHILRRGGFFSRILRLGKRT